MLSWPELLVPNKEDDETKKRWGSSTVCDGETTRDNGTVKSARKPKKVQGDRQHCRLTVDSGEKPAKPPRTRASNQKVHQGILFSKTRKRVRHAPVRQQHSKSANQKHKTAEDGILGAACCS